MAQIRGKPVYTISDVSLIPLSSQSDAEQAITRARETQRRHAKSHAAGEEDEPTSSEYSSGNEEREPETLPTSELPSLPASPPPEGETGLAKRKTSIAEDVISRKGMYGRFAGRWFSKKGWSADSRRSQGMSSGEDLTKTMPERQGVVLSREQSQEGHPEEDEDESVQKDLEISHQQNQDEVLNVPPKEVSHAAQASAEEIRIPLLPKVLTVTKLFYGSKNFYFSYDFDLSKNLVNQARSPASTDLPLHRTFDPLVR